VRSQRESSPRFRQWPVSSRWSRGNSHRGGEGSAIGSVARSRSRQPQAAAGIGRPGPAAESAALLTGFPCPPQRLVGESLQVNLEAGARYRRLAVLWSVGRTSTPPWNTAHTARPVAETALEAGSSASRPRHTEMPRSTAGGRTWPLWTCAWCATRRPTGPPGVLPLRCRPPVENRLASGGAGRGRPGSPGVLGGPPGLRRGRSRPTGFSRRPWRTAWPQAGPVEADRVLQASLEKRSAASAMPVAAQRGLAPKGLRHGVAPIACQAGLRGLLSHSSHGVWRGGPWPAA
jgi:hypothetical protein